MADFSHLDQNGQATMVDISGKIPSEREARVYGAVTVPVDSIARIHTKAVAEIKTTARIAGIQAAKQTSSLIPLCHQVPLSKVEVSINWHGDNGQFSIEGRCKTAGTTGVEMEAFVATQIAALTIYDMIKAICPETSLGPFVLLEKIGGKAGSWQRPVTDA